VEAGARLVTVNFSTVPGQKAFRWDDHASVWSIFEQMKIRLPVLDQVVSALIQDLHERQLQDDVLLVVMGEIVAHAEAKRLQGPAGARTLGPDDVGPAGRRWVTDGASRRSDEHQR
jgi:hypothetical protein